MNLHGSLQNISRNCISNLFVLRQYAATQVQKTHIFLRSAPKYVSRSWVLLLFLTTMKFKNNNETYIPWDKMTLYLVLGLTSPQTHRSYLIYAWLHFPVQTKQNWWKLSQKWGGGPAIYSDDRYTPEKGLGKTQLYNCGRTPIYPTRGHLN